MLVFKIRDALADKYHGAGYSLAASVNGELVALIYIRDVLPNLDLENDSAVLTLLNDTRLGPTVRLLSALGVVHFGMCSCWEFVEL